MVLPMTNDELQQIRRLNEEKAQLMEDLRKVGPAALSGHAKSAALRRIAEINQEIRDIENPPVIVENPLDKMTVEELKALYAQKYEAYLGRKVGEPVDPHSPRRSRDAHAEAELSGIMTRIQRLEAKDNA